MTTLPDHVLEAMAKEKGHDKVAVASPEELTAVIWGMAGIAFCPECNAYIGSPPEEVWQRGARREPGDG